MSNDAYVPDYGDDRELQLNHEEFELFIYEQKKLKEKQNETDSTSIMQSTKRVFPSIKDSDQPPF